MDDKPLGTFMPGDVAAKQFEREIDAVPAGDAKGIGDAACRKAHPRLRDRPPSGPRSLARTGDPGRRGRTGCRVA